LETPSFEWENYVTRIKSLRCAAAFCCDNFFLMLFHIMSFLSIEERENWQLESDIQSVFYLIPHYVKCGAAAALAEQV
jgi:hypothetical protein